MAYATQQDIIDRYSSEQLLIVFDRDGSGVVDTDAVTRALADADAEIDGYLAGRYPLPLAAPVPGNLTFMAVDIALYHGAVGGVVTEEARKRYDDAIRYLTKVANGTVPLGTGNDTPTGASGAASFTGNERLFTRDKMRGL